MSKQLIANIRGPQGIQGIEGPEGPQGIQGPEGPQGIQGVDGPRGFTGFQGIQGPEGPQGLEGPEGPQGLQGIDGPRGLQGLQGLEGPRGLQGIQGEPGNPTSFELRGSGFPEGVVTAGIGTYYTDILGTNGAIRWVKTTSTGKTGWKVVVGDTGWRDVSASFSNILTLNTARICRTNAGVSLHYRGVYKEGFSSSTSVILPAGFNPDGIIINEAFSISIRANGSAESSWMYYPSGQSSEGYWRSGWNPLPASGSSILCSGFWLCSRPWPTILP